LMENFVFIPFDRSLTKIAARIRREAKVKFPDAAIAATALFTQTALVTRNVKDFRKINSIFLQEI
ncbi:MAG: PIN domain-containing protein, partial [Parcubacteria group bacterium]|nr:PIN domain-containing protein [Parcubacteria group bacterium]